MQEILSIINTIHRISILKVRPDNQALQQGKVTTLLPVKAVLVVKDHSIPTLPHSEKCQRVVTSRVQENR
jgi:hypothetical protein